MTNKSDKRHTGATPQHDEDSRAGASAPAAAQNTSSAGPVGAASGKSTALGANPVGRDAPGAPLPGGAGPVTATPSALEVALAEARDWKERAARAQAEFENTRKRLIASQDEALGRATDRVIEGLLPVVDDLDLAIAHGQEAGSDLCQGLLAIRDKIRAAFAREGVEVIDPQPGEPFDHMSQSAMQVVKRDDMPDQSVAQVFQKGYRRGARIIRPAMVIVSKS